MTPIFLGLGSNIEREPRLVAGLDALAEFVRDLRCSPVFESRPVGIKSGNFYNLVVSGYTELSLHELDLARRVSDTVVCVAGDHIDRVGPPEEIFTRAYIAKLYRMEHGKYDPCFDSLEFVP